MMISNVQSFLVIFCLNIGDATPPNDGLNGDEHVIDDSIVASSVKIEPNQNLNGQDVIILLDDDGGI